MQKYKEINGNDYVKDSRTTINETMQSIQSMNSGTAFPTNNLFEGMKCYRTDLKKTYTLTDVENNTWVEDAHAALSDEATHAVAADTATKVNATVPSDKVGELVKAKMGDNDAFRIAVGGSANNGWVELATADDGTESIYVRQYAEAKTYGFVTPTRTATLLDGSGNTSFPGKVTAPNFIGSLNGNAATATKLQTPRTLALTGKAAGSATFDGSDNASINVTSVNADTASKLSTARKINITGNASGSAAFDGTSDVSINVSVNESKHADKATQDTNGRAFTDTNAYMHISALANNTDFNNVKTTGIYYCTGNTHPNRPHNSCGILTVYSIGTVKQEYKPDNAAVYYTREYNNANWTEWSKVAASTADSATNADTVDGVHADSLFYNKGNWDANNWATIGTYQVNNNPPVSDAYPWGQVISSSTNDARFQLYVSHVYEGTGRLYYRTGWGDDKQPWNTILDSENYNSFAPTKTGGGASGTWDINISGNADNATKWNGIIDDHTTENNTDTWIPVFVDGKMQHTDRTKMTVGNADTVDGYHASDLLDKITAANTGIVAASLTENGYAKFANGLILQWGNASGGRGDEDNSTTFPIAFPSTCFVVLLTSKDVVTNRICNQSKTGFAWKNGLISWAALGM